MVKGVNKQIIEINDTGNKYFEKVLLFVAPGKAELPKEILYARAKEYVIEFSDKAYPNVSLREKMMRKKAKKRRLVLSGAVVAIVLVTAAIINFL